MHAQFCILFGNKRENCLDKYVQSVHLLSRQSKHHKDFLHGEQNDPTFQQSESVPVEKVVVMTVLTEKRLPKRNEGR